MSEAAKGYLGYVLSHQQDSRILPLIENAVECRTELAPSLPGNRWASPPIPGSYVLSCSLQAI